VEFGFHSVWLRDKYVGVCRSLPRSPLPRGCCCCVMSTYQPHDMLSTSRSSIQLYLPASGHAVHLSQFHTAVAAYRTSPPSRLQHSVPLRSVVEMQLWRNCHICSSLSLSVCLPRLWLKWQWLVSTNCLYFSLSVLRSSSLAFTFHTDSWRNCVPIQHKLVLCCSTVRDDS
jgi:hypothetical protein